MSRPTNANRHQSTQTRFLDSGVKPAKKQVNKSYEKPFVSTENFWAEGLYLFEVEAPSVLQFPTLAIGGIQIGIGLGVVVEAHGLRVPVECLAGEPDRDGAEQGSLGKRAAIAEV